MIEILLIIQTIAIIVILVVFLYVLKTIKSEFLRFKDEIEIVKRDLTPLISIAKTNLETMNKIMQTVDKAAENGEQIIEKVKNSITVVEDVCYKIKSGYDKTLGRASLLKMGIQAGIGSIVGYYIKKRRTKNEL